MRDSIAIKWHEVGVELLKQKGKEVLRVIETDNAGNVNKCCTKMLELWLDRQPEATWNQLIEALRSPGIQLNDVASKLERMLTSAVKGN